MSAEQTPDIAAVLAEHREDPHYPDTCVCEVEVPDAAGHYVRHVAAALAPVLAAAVREAESRAWDNAHGEFCAQANNCWGGGCLHENPYRADRITEPASHEAATSGKEA